MIVPLYNTLLRFKLVCLCSSLSLESGETLFVLATTFRQRQSSLDLLKQGKDSPTVKTQTARAWGTSWLTESLSAAHPGFCLILI